MDNASKALVMAGAILIAVMLISLGVVLFTRAQDIADQTSNQVNNLAIQAYNSGYTDYLGDRVRGTTVKQLINKGNTHNANTEDQSAYGTLTFTGKTSVNDIVSSSYYKVTVTKYEGPGGAISEIDIQDATATK